MSGKKVQGNVASIEAFPASAPVSGTAFSKMVSGRRVVPAASLRDILPASFAVKETVSPKFLSELDDRFLLMAPEEVESFDPQQYDAWLERICQVPFSVLKDWQLAKREERSKARSQLRQERASIVGHYGHSLGGNDENREPEVHPFLQRIGGFT